MTIKLGKAREKELCLPLASLSKSELTFLRLYHLGQLYLLERETAKETDLDYDGVDYDLQTPKNKENSMGPNQSSFSS